MDAVNRWRGIRGRVAAQRRSICINFIRMKLIRVLHVGRLSRAWGKTRVSRVRDTLSLTLPTVPPVLSVSFPLLPWQTIPFLPFHIFVRSLFSYDSEKGKEQSKKYIHCYSLYTSTIRKYVLIHWNKNNLGIDMRLHVICMYMVQTVFVTSKSYYSANYSSLTTTRRSTGSFEVCTLTCI